MQMNDDYGSASSLATAGWTS